MLFIILTFQVSIQPNFTITFLSSNRNLSSCTLFLLNDLNVPRNLLIFFSFKPAKKITQLSGYPLHGMNEI